MKCFRTLNLKVLGIALLAFFSACNPEKTIVNSPNLNLTDHMLIKNWYSLSLELGPKCNGFTEPIMARSLSYFSILMHESLYRGIPGLKSYKGSSDGFNFNLPEPDLSVEYNWSIVANEAALVYFENVFGSSGDQFLRAVKLYHDQLVKYSTGVDSSIQQNSKFFGRQLAFGLLKFAEEDGQSLAHLNVYPSNYVLPKGEGQWIPTTPDYTPKPMLPYWGKVRPIVRSNVEVLLLNKELSYSNLGTSNMYAEAIEVYSSSLAINDTQKEIAAYFSREMGVLSQPLYHNYLLALQLITEKQLDLPKSLELLCKMSFAMHDGYISCYNYLYKKNILRVSSYIRQLIDRTFQPPYGSMPLPEGISDKAVCYAVGAEILSNFFGYRQTFIDKTQVERPELRTKSMDFASFQEMSIEATQADIYTGVHFRTSIESGRKLGTDVARNIMTSISK